MAGETKRIRVLGWVRRQLCQNLLQGWAERQEVALSSAPVMNGLLLRFCRNHDAEAPAVTLASMFWFEVVKHKSAGRMSC